MAVAQVMECSWARLVKKVEAAEDLDQVIEAHDSFLEQITTQCLLDPGSQVRMVISSMQLHMKSQLWSMERGEVLSLYPPNVCMNVTWAGVVFPLLSRS